MHKIFRYPNFLKFWGDVRELFRLCETIIIRRKNAIPPVMHKIFRYPKFSGTLKGCPRNILALWDQKFWTEKRDTPLFMHKTFRNQNISQKQYDSLTRFFGIVRQNFRLKIVILPPPSPPPLLCIIFFRYQIFSDTQIRKVPLRNFSALRQKKISTQNREINLWSIKSFDTRN